PLGHCRFHPTRRLHRWSPSLFRRLITGDRELEMLGRYEENAYFWRMLKVAGHPDVVLRELQGFDHGGMAEPAHGLLIKFVRERSAQDPPK
ncbi:MAG: hypothetical protein AAFU85_15335, partial [Planctomycetota bacterium]